MLSTAQGRAMLVGALVGGYVVLAVAVFSDQDIYAPIPWLSGFMAGAVVAVPLWLWMERSPRP
jgi:hypothetical protein